MPTTLLFDPPPPRIFSTSYVPAAHLAETGKKGFPDCIFIVCCKYIFRSKKLKNKLVREKQKLRNSFKKCVKLIWSHQPYHHLKSQNNFLMVCHYFLHYFFFIFTRILKKILGLIELFPIQQSALFDERSEEKSERSKVDL